MHDEGGRLSLAAVNGAAEAAGLGVGLPLADARAFLPDLKTASLEPEADARALAQLAAWCGRYTPWSALDPAGGGLGVGILLDVTGCAHLFGGEAALLADLVTRLGALGFTARAASADTVGTAWAAARFACPASSGQPWCVVPEGSAREALAPLPPAALRLLPATDELLARFGLRRIGALYDLPPAVLEPRFGPVLASRLHQALGTSPETLSPLLPAPRYLARRVFAEPIMTPEDIARGLALLAGELEQRLEAEAQGARRLELALYRVDGSLRRLALGTSRPSRDPDHLARLFTRQLERIDPGFGIEVMTLAATATESLTALQLALEPGGGQLAAAGDLAGLIDRLGARLGLDKVFRQAPRESHLPERVVRRVPALDDKRIGNEATAWRRGQPRPLTLLRRPEAIEAVALLPDYPPARFHWRRVPHRVVRAEGPERIAAEWWLDDTPEKAAPARDYFRVEDEDGRRYWLYRAGSRWFMHGLFA